MLQELSTILVGTACCTKDSASGVRVMGLQCCTSHRTPVTWIVTLVSNTNLHSLHHRPLTIDHRPSRTGRLKAFALLNEERHHRYHRHTAGLSGTSRICTDTPRPRTLATIQPAIARAKERSAVTAGGASPQRSYRRRPNPSSARLFESSCAVRDACTSDANHASGGTAGRYNYTLRDRHLVHTRVVSD